MENVDINDFKEVKDCTYKDERYSVRDNGAVMRHKREGKQIRKKDETWTFGKKNEQNGYMYFGTHRIHIIVATAFYGKNDSKTYIVDHIDTNRCNNRKENLRWITRLENVLLNPITLKRVTFLCGGNIMNFIKDPSCLKDATGTNQDLSWMRTVTPKEAETAYNNVMNWSARPSTEKKTNKSKKGTAKEWIFKENTYLKNNIHLQTPKFIKALSPENALQRNWRTPTNYPCCPCPTDEKEPLQHYANLLIKGKIFSYNYYSEHEIIDKAIIEEGKSIIIITHDTTQNAIKPFAVAKIYHSGGQYIHENIQSFFEENGARKRYTILQGLEWNEPDPIDDYC